VPGCNSSELIAHRTVDELAQIPIDDRQGAIQIAGAIAPRAAARAVKDGAMPL
jgi:hypothetical protein